VCVCIACMHKVRGACSSHAFDSLCCCCCYFQITFREILTHYKRQAHAKQEVFRTVVLKHTDPHLVTQTNGDIIAFYNAVSALSHCFASRHSVCCGGLSLFMYSWGMVLGGCTYESHLA
jgi:hypothetical protein